MADRFQPQREPGGVRYYLEGRPVHAGDVLEIQLDDGAWHAARFEWTFDKNEPAPYVVVQDGAGRELVQTLTATTMGRWPHRED